MKKYILLAALILTCLLVLNKCSFHSLPKERIPVLKLDMNEEFVNNQYSLTIENTIDCPMRYILSSDKKEIQELLEEISPILIAPRADTTLVISNQGDLKGMINININWGDPDLPIVISKIESLPFLKGDKYKLLQGNNSTPTHNTKTSRYAFDFTMKIGDTITSVQEGYVVGVRDEYKGWGMSDKWKPYGNLIMIYDTTSYLFTLYGHLKYDGAMVEIGDYVKIGQPIALSGKTGQTTEEHLHFNVFQASRVKSGLQSYPLDSIGRYKVSELKRYQWMIN